MQLATAVLQIGFVPVHRVVFDAEHSAQVPARQTGNAPLQSAARQPRHVLVFVSQNAVLPVHAEVSAAEHWRQTPATHAGPPALPTQSESPKQGAHLPLTLQTGVELPHFDRFVALHSLHWPDAARHAGFAGSLLLHSPSLKHGLTHVPAGVQPCEHFPGSVAVQGPQEPSGRHTSPTVLPVQSELDWHLRQLPVERSQAGVASLQATAFVEEHCRQAPPAQTAPAELPAHSGSPAQARHTFVATSQTGTALAAAQSAALVGSQPHSAAAVHLPPLGEHTVPAAATGPSTHAERSPLHTFGRQAVPRDSQSPQRRGLELSPESTPESTPESKPESTPESTSEGRPSKSSRLST